MFTQQQIIELLQILDYHYLMSISTGLGIDVFENEELALMLSFGVNLTEINKIMPLYDKMFILGKLTSILSDSQVKQLDYVDFTKYINKGQYQPLTTREKYSLEIAKRKSYLHLKGLKEKSRNEFESIILDGMTLTKKQYEEAVSEELVRGVAERKSVGNIVSELGHRVNNWGHDWGRIVDTEMNNIFQTGRAAEMKEKTEDPLVYKNVYEGACRHCIRLYLQKGLDSEPIVFKLSTLEANGTNVGRLVKDWKATVGGIHPFCRCTLYFLMKGYVWNKETQRFEVPKDFVRRVERKSKIKITIGEKVMLV